MIRGHVVDERTGLPLQGVRVDLLDPAGTPRADDVSDAEGRFTLRAPSEGSWRVRLEYLVADSVVVREVDVPPEGVQVPVRVPMEPLEMPPIVVEVYTTDLLRMLPGVSVVPRRGGHGMDVSMRGGVARCAPAVILDGVHVTLDFYTSLDDLVHPDEIRGMEVYASLGGAPLLYMIGNRCGAILIWTK